MEISLLDGLFRRNRLIEGWNSLIWTERYSTNGDFELTSPNISEVMSLLPLGNDVTLPMVAISDSNVPMVVESHKIEKPKNGSPYIVTTGRSFETVLDRRVAVRAVTSGVKRVEWQIEAQNAALAAYTAAKTIVVDGAATALDIIPEINLINGVIDSGVTQKFPVEPKDLYVWMIETLALGKYGLKSILPTGDSGKVTVQTYKGSDRRNFVVFDVSLGQIEEAAYFLSKLGYKNVMITSTANGMEISTTGTSPSGLARRVDFQDLSSEVTLPAGSDLTNLTVNKGKVALADRLPTALFSGGVAASIGDEFKKTYALGDIIKLQGEFGLSQDARVAEFVRTHDQTGVKAYPTFEAYP